jgi:hypothetical protein
MTTFSQLVDKVVLETSRPDMLSQIADYLNQTIREIHAEPERGKVYFYESNYREAQVTAASETGLTWTIPNVAIFQKELCVRFDNQWSRDGEPVYAEKMTPGPNMHRKDYFYYRGADSLIFGGRIGYGGLNAKVSIAYYEYPKGLKYYALADRPATYDYEAGWTYGAGIVTPEQQLAAQERVSNWVLLRWEQVLLEGLRAKVYKRTGDETRQRTCYSMFMQLRNLLVSSEAGDAGGYTT